MNRLPNLDVLRFFLASAVVLFHIPKLSRNQGLPFYDELPIFHRGHEAVYMFFVLSGFLIIQLIYRAKLKHVFSIRKFYMRRILRIFPLYYLILIFGFTFYNFILPQLNIDFDIRYELW
ncbi:MAG: acyltransferase family protein, partial [Bacteroidia bacterium]|nr:acyltransferase family protein [Bacteroidia bacterium]